MTRTSTPTATATTAAAAYSVVKVTKCVTTTANSNLSCAVSYTAGDSLVLNVSLGTGSTTFYTPQSVGDGVNAWVADSLTGGGACQSDDNSGYSTCFYHANNIAGTSANLSVALPSSYQVGFIAAYVYEVSGGTLIEDVGAGQGYSANPYAASVNTPQSGPLAATTDIVFASAGAYFVSPATISAGPTAGFTGQALLNAGGTTTFATNLFSAYLMPGNSSSTSTGWTENDSTTWSSAIIAYKSAEGGSTASPTVTSDPTSTPTSGTPGITATATASSTVTATATGGGTSKATPTGVASAAMVSTTAVQAKASRIGVNMDMQSQYDGRAYLQNYLDNPGFEQAMVGHVIIVGAEPVERGLQRQQRQL